MALEVGRKKGRKTLVALLLLLANDPSPQGKSITEIHTELNQRYGIKSKTGKLKEFCSRVTVSTYLKELVMKGYVISESEISNKKIIPKEERKYGKHSLSHSTFNVRENFYRLLVKVTPKNVCDIFQFVWKSTVDRKEGFSAIHELMSTDWYRYECSYMSGTLEVILDLDRNYSVPDNIQINDYMWRDPTLKPSIHTRFGEQFKLETQVIPEKLQLSGPFSTFPAYDSTFYSLITTFPEVASIFFDMIENGEAVVGESSSDRYYHYMKQFFDSTDTESNSKFFNTLYGAINLSHAVFPEHFKLYYVLGIPFGNIGASRLENIAEMERQDEELRLSRTLNDSRYKNLKLIWEISKYIADEYDGIKANPNLIDEWCGLHKSPKLDEKIVECLIDRSIRVYDFLMVDSEKRHVFNQRGEYRSNIREIIKKRVMAAIA